MAKRNELSDQARAMYKNGEKLVDIAKKIGVPDSTVRRWKSTQKWDEHNPNARVQKSERSDRVLTRIKKDLEEEAEEILENDALNSKQKFFCIYYARSFNATKSYQKAYGCSYESAMTSASDLLRNPKIKKEIDRLKKLKAEQILAGPEDIVEIQMRIAFADIGDYLTFGQREEAVMSIYGPVQIKDENTGEKKELTKMVNFVDLNESECTDTQLIQEIRQGKDGISIKLANREKALDWLSNYFEMNPKDKHKQEYDKRKLELELLKFEMKNTESQEEEETEDNFLDALNATAKEVWPDE